MSFKSFCQNRCKDIQSCDIIAEKELILLAMVNYTDQLGNTVYLKEPPKRIISIVPSQSEFLWDLGLADKLVGITKFCIHPETMFRSIERVGGTKQLDLEKIRSLKPDLIIGNKEENEQSQIEELQKEFAVWMSDIYTFADSFAMMLKVGEIVGKKEEARVIVDELKNSLKAVKNIFAKKEVAYFIWNKPYMFAAKNTFIDHVLSYLGLENALSNYERYPEMTEQKLKELNPTFCFLSSEPFPFKEKHIKELQAVLPNSKILIVDGELFSWYGSRLLHLADYVKKLKVEMESL
jgi:ABC-type Fe3+-hydroxamate transport system substrate-binding protein